MVPFGACTEAARSSMAGSARTSGLSISTMPGPTPSSFNSGMAPSERFIQWTCSQKLRWTLVYGVRDRIGRQYSGMHKNSMLTLKERNGEQETSYRSIPRISYGACTRHCRLDSSDIRQRSSKHDRCCSCIGGGRRPAGLLLRGHDLTSKIGPTHSRTRSPTPTMEYGYAIIQSP